MCKKTMLAGIKRIEAVLSYGLDAHSDLSARTTLLQDFDLTIDTFFDKLYIERPEAEHNLFSSLTNGVHPVMFIGAIGRGKTTLLHKVLRDYTRATSLPSIIVDFKTAERRNSNSGLDVEALIDQEGMPQIRRFMKQMRRDAHGNPLPEHEQPAMNDLARILLKSGNQRFLTNHNAKVAGHVYDHFEDTDAHKAGEPFDQWVAACEDENHEDYHFMLGIRRQLKENLTFVECAFALAELTRSEHRDRGESGRFNKLIVAFDNVDSLNDLKLIDQLVLWMKEESARYQKYVTLVAAVRPQNIQQATRVGVFSEGSFHVHNLSISDSVLAEDAKRFYEDFLTDRYYDDRTDANEKLGRLTPDQQTRIQFDNLIHAKRVSFVGDVVRTGSLSGVTLKELQAVTEAATEVLSNRSISIDMAMQANGNRRLHLAGVAAFLDYVVGYLSLDWELIGIRPSSKKQSADKTGRGSALKSLYYRFLGSARTDSVHPLVIDTIAFNIVNSVYRVGWDRNVLANNVTTQTVASEFCNVLVVFAVHNACGHTVDYASNESASVNAVIEDCAMFGLTRAQVIASLTTAIRSRVFYQAGFFEIDHFIAIRDLGREITGDERIVATDRCRSMVQNIVYMCNYLCECLRTDSKRDHAGDVVSEDILSRGLVEPEVLNKFIHWICKFVTLEMWLVEAVSKTSRSSLAQDWLKKYFDTVVLRRSHGQAPALMSERIVKVAIGFVSFCITTHIEEDENALKKAYKNARKDLETILSKIEVARANVAKGTLWSIPKTRALQL